MRSTGADVVTHVILFLIGTAGFVGLFLSWPLILCLILMALGWGLIFISSGDGIDFDF